MRENDKNLVPENSKKSDVNTHRSKWNRYLDDYNNYVEEYNKHYLNSKNGDKRSLLLYPYMKEKWRKFKKILLHARDKKKLSQTQIDTVTKIDLKIIK